MPKAISTVWYNSQQYASLRDKESIQAVQRTLTSKAQENVYCQIHNKDIPPARCLMSQFQKECLGCSAPTHLCHSCRMGKIAFPAVELCDSCLKVALTLEKNAGKLELPRDLQVPCLLIDKTIKVKTCRTMQGEKCRGCEQSSRFCLECKERPARYPIEGLCLTCLVKNFGEGWESNRNEDGTLNSESVKIQRRTTRRNESLAEITEPDSTAVTALVPESETGYIHALTPELLARAISVVVQYQICKPHTLAKQLKLDEETALQLQRALISFGLVKEVPRIIDHAVSVSTHHELAGCDKIPAEVRKILGLSPLTVETPAPVISTQDVSSGLSKTEANNARRLQVLSDARNDFPVPKKFLAGVIIQIIKHQRCGFNFFHKKCKIQPSKAKKIRSYLANRGILRWSHNKARTFLTVSFTSCHDLLKSSAPLAPDLSEEIYRQLQGDTIIERGGAAKNLQPDKQVLDILTPRQREITCLLIKHFIERSKVLTSRRIAQILNISDETVNMHIRDIFTALGVHSRSALICRVLTLHLNLAPTQMGLETSEKQVSKKDFGKIKIPLNPKKMSPPEKSNALIAFAEVFEKLFGEKSFGGFLRLIASDVKKFSNISRFLKKVINDAQ